MTLQITMRVDRDSVAMGDDAKPHAYDLPVVAGTMLSAVLEKASPEIRVAGLFRLATGRSIDEIVALMLPDTAG
ncbi:hypothetical protein [Microbacterium sp. SD291]|uniref:hypothetical protein n=1 Tax=Microbacterium sp. SD291 TaxID=2782007 RepID=UPI001A95EF12|nr:hypothetical protein [Microbacterium sp. SD291]MBO0982110.1 hypothetical protein [Microbacterium sp. SD291]